MSATPFHYVPGTAVALASASVGILLAVDADHLVIDPLLEELTDTTTVDDVIDFLLRGGLRRLPDFGCLERTPDGVRVVVRGAVTGVPDSGDVVSSGSGPWVDVVVPSEVVLRVGDAAGGRRMPFRGGVALASEVSFAPVAAPPFAWPEPTRDEDAPAPEPNRDEDAPAPAPASAATDDEEPAIDFDFLFNATVHPTALPDAHVPPLPEAAPAPAAEQAPTPAVEPPVDPALTSPSPFTANLADLGADQSDPVPPASPGLIQGLPWEQGAAFAPPPPSQPASPAAPTSSASFAPPAPPAPVAAPAPPASFAPPTPPAPPAPPAPPVYPASGWQQPGQIPSPPPAPLDDPVARTINRSQLRGAGAAPTVLAVRCPHGHLSPAFATNCRVCRAPLAPQQHFEVPRPTLGVLQLSTGAIVQLDRGAILGRNPRVPPDHAGGQPNLVQVVDPGRDVSGQHLEVALDFWNVVVRDLGSTNGTEVVLPGEMPVSLRPHQPMIIEPGSKVVMAGAVSFVFEATA